MFKIKLSQILIMPEMDEPPIGMIFYCAVILIYYENYTIDSVTIA